MVVDFHVSKWGKSPIHYGELYDPSNDWLTNFALQGSTVKIQDQLSMKATKEQIKEIKKEFRRLDKLYNIK